MSKFEKITLSIFISAALFFLGLTICAQLWVAIYYPPAPKYNIMHIFVPKDR